MAPILAATLSAYVVILLGIALTSRDLAGPGFWDGAQKLNYYVLLPVLFMFTLATAPTPRLWPTVGFVAAIIATLTIGAALALMWRRRSFVRADITMPMVEGSVRANVPLGAMVAFALFGIEGLTLFVAAAMIYLPTVILIGAFVRSREDNTESGDGEGAFAGAARMLARNPIILGALAGVVLNLTGAGVISGLSGVLQVMALAALPVGVLATGAQLDLGAAQNAIEVFRRDVLAVLALKLLVLPAIAASVAAAFGLGGVAAAAVILLAALPAVSPRFTMAAPEPGGPSLIRGLAAAAIVAGLVTLPLALWVLI